MQVKTLKWLLLGFFTIKQPLYSIINQGSDNGAYNPEFSLYIEEPVSQDWVYKSWTGFIPNVWMSTEHIILYSFTDRFRAGLGLSHVYSFQNDLNLERTQIRGILEYRLW